MGFAQGHGATSGDQSQDLMIQSLMLYHYATTLSTSMEVWNSGADPGII